MREIKVDMDVFAAIWKQRVAGENSENEILRRLLLNEPYSDQQGSPVKKEVKNSRIHDENALQYQTMGKIRWVDDIKAALIELGGEATLQEIYKKVKDIRLRSGRSWTAAAEATIRRTIEDHSSDSENFRGDDIFKKIGRGKWALRLPSFALNDSSPPRR